MTAIALEVFAAVLVGVLGLVFVALGNGTPPSGTLGIVARGLVSGALLGTLLFNPLWLVDKGRTYSFGALAYWAGQWAVLWAALLGTALAVASAGLWPNRTAWAGLGVVLLCLVLTLPELSDMDVTGKPPRLGLLNYLRLKRENARFRARHFQLEEPRVIDGVALPRGTRVELDEQSNLLQATAPFGTLKVGELEASWVTFFAGTGVPSSALLVTDQVLRGVPCMGEPNSSQANVEFSADGTLTAFHLAAPYRLGKETWQRDAWVRLTTDEISIFHSGEVPRTVAGLLVPPHTRVTLFPDGRLKALRGDGSMRVHGIAVREVSFDGQGAVVDAVLGEDVTAAGKVLSVGTLVVIDAHGAVRER